MHTSNPQILHKNQYSDPDAICIQLPASMYGSVSPSVVCYIGLYVNAAIFPPSLLRCPLLSATASVDGLKHILKTFVVHHLHLNSQMKSQFCCASSMH